MRSHTNPGALAATERGTATVPQRNHAPLGRLSAWAQDRSVRTRVLSLVGVSVAALSLCGVVASLELASAGERTETLNAANGATRSALLADMMHDAIRSDEIGRAHV